MTVVEDEARKVRFFDQLIKKHGPPGGIEFERPGYPIIDRITLYEFGIERLTYKRSLSLRH